MSVGIHVNREHASGHAGGHTSIVEHIEAARRTALDEAGVRLSVAAIFVGGPRHRAITLTAEEGAELRRYIAATGLRVFAHSAYAASPWDSDPATLRYIHDELKTCQAAGIEGLVVHLPKRPIAAVLPVLAKLCAPAAPDVRIYLETPAVRPDESYYETPAKLAALFRAIRAGVDPGLEQFGLCVDTAHLWTCGIDLRTRAVADRWLRDLEAASATIPASCVIFHLNDSQRERGTGPDMHAALGAGKIWAGVPIARSGLAAVTDYAKRHGTPLILERKPKTALLGDYRVLRRLLPE